MYYFWMKLCSAGFYMESTMVSILILFNFSETVFCQKQRLQWCYLETKIAMVYFRNKDCNGVFQKQKLQWCFSETKIAMVFFRNKNCNGVFQKQRLNGVFQKQKLEWCFSETKIAMVFFRNKDWMVSFRNNDWNGVFQKQRLQWCFSETKIGMVSFRNKDCNGVIYYSTFANECLMQIVPMKHSIKNFSNKNVGNSLNNIRNLAGIPYHTEVVWVEWSDLAICNMYIFQYNVYHLHILLMVNIQL